MIHQLVVVTAASLLAQSGPLHRAPPVSRMAFPVNPPTTGAAIYHTGASLVCSDCHVMHASEAHDMDGDLVREAWGLPYLSTPNQTLLRKATTNELCLECHDGKTFAPDVLGADVNGGTERSAGMFDDRGVANPRGHSLSAQDLGGPDALCDRCHFGGSMATATVQCIDCHAPHGNQGYRNLQWASWPGGEPQILAYTRPGATGLARYEADNVRYPAPGGSAAWREITNVCIDCHHAFMDDSSGYYTKPGGMAHFGRHPGTNTEWGVSRPINAPGANTTPDNWVSGTVGFDVPRLKFMVTGATDFDAAGVVAANNEVFCLTCHKAHGSDRQFGLRWDYGQVSAPTQNSGCAQCHANARGQ